MVAWNLVFAEEVLDNKLTALAVVEGAVTFEKGADTLRSQVGMGNLFLRQHLDALQDGLIAHIQHDQLCGR